ncbi:hypothetical protein [Bradyrhizobium paxllaeri]|uniref:hypothetical protein n=1 Tax=Bradyrhizobium paxllaeri TaxID=190148 RepID=UPI000810806E|nr:hypothetical protein [Bradyrhizobium paxllaeri]
MRKFILIAGFVLTSAAALAGDRSLSLGGIESPRAPAPAKAVVDAPKTAEAPPEPPKYVERPAIETPRAETPKAETPKADASRVETSRTETARPRAARAYRPAAASAHAALGRPAFRRTASMHRSVRPHRIRYSIQARIVRALHQHGIYW